MDNQYNENDIFETEKVEERENPVEQVKAEEPPPPSLRRGRRQKKRELPRKICAVVLSAALFGSVASAAFYRGKQIPRRFVLLDGIHFKRLDRP